MDLQTEYAMNTEIREVQPGWLEQGGARVSLFDTHAGIMAFQRAFWDEAASSELPFLYRAGLLAGSAMTRDLEGDSPNELLDAGLAVLQNRGWGAYQRWDELPADQSATGDGPTLGAVIAVGEAFEVCSYLGWHQRGAEPPCQFTAGLLAGIARQARRAFHLSHDNVHCREIACLAQGDDVCRFEFYIFTPGSSKARHGGAEASASVDIQEASYRTEARANLSDGTRGHDNVYRDVAALYREVLQRERTYKSLLENMNDILMVLDREQRVVFCNNRFTEASGLTVEQAHGLCPLEFIWPADRPEVQRIYERLLAGDTTATTYTFTVGKPREPRFFESSARPIVGSSGLVEGIEILARNCTEREKARRELQAAHDLLLHKQAIADNDMWVAKLVHESLLPQSVSLQTLDVDIRYRPAGSIGGDYCHIAYPPDGCLITLYDVSGHGMASAMLAARVHSHLRVLTETLFDPLAITIELNHFLRAHFADVGLFVTSFVIAVDLETMRFRYCGAGHPGALYLRPSTGALAVLASQLLPLGVVDDFPQELVLPTGQLLAGERLLLYTDGIIETADADGLPLRLQGLCDWFSQTVATPVFQVGDSLLQRMENFGTGAAVDDVTLITLEAKTPRS